MYVCYIEIVTMRLPDSAHTSQPWRIHELARDFEVEDVWALPTPGGREDFPLLVEGFASADPAKSGSGAVRALFALRWKVGELLGWDGEESGIGSRAPRLPGPPPLGPGGGGAGAGVGGPSVPTPPPLRHEGGARSS